MAVPPNYLSFFYGVCYIVSKTFASFELELAYLLHIIVYVVVMFMYENDIGLKLGFLK